MRPITTYASVSYPFNARLVDNELELTELPSLDQQPLEQINFFRSDPGFRALYGRVAGAVRQNKNREGYGRYNSNIQELFDRTIAQIYQLPNDKNGKDRAKELLNKCITEYQDEKVYGPVYKDEIFARPVNLQIFESLQSKSSGLDALVRSVVSTIENSWCSDDARCMSAQCILEEALEKIDEGSDRFQATIILINVLRKYRDLGLSVLHDILDKKYFFRQLSVKFGTLLDCVMETIKNDPQPDVKSTLESALKEIEEVPDTELNQAINILENVLKKVECISLEEMTEGGPDILINISPISPGHNALDCVCDF